MIAMMCQLVITAKAEKENDNRV